MLLCIISVLLCESQHRCIIIFVVMTLFDFHFFLSSGQNNDGSSDNGEHHPESDDVPPTSQSTEEANQVFKKEEKEKEQNLTSTPDKVPSTLAPLQLSQLRTKNTDSFDIEEVHDILGAVRLNILKIQ